MKKEDARIFTCILAENLDLPSMVCESIESKLINGKYEEVIRFTIKRYIENHKKSESLE